MNTTKIKQNIPKGWQAGKFGQFIIDIKDGGTPSRHKKEYFGGGIPWVVIKDIKPKIKTTSESLSQAGLKNSSAKLFPAGTIILSFGATIGEVGIAEVDVATKQGIAGVLHDKQVIDSHYLYFYLQSLKQRLNQLASGSTIKEVRPPIIKSIDALLPPLPEQKKIAEILETVDEEIEKTEQIITATEKLKKGLVVSLFSNQANSKVYKVKEISEVTSSKRVMAADYVKEGVPFYRSTEIIKKSKNISVTSPLYISFEKFKTFKDRFGAPEAGDLLITAVGTIGDVYLVRNETFYFKDGNSVWIRKIKDNVLPKYLKMILASSFYRDKLNSIAGGSSQKALTIQKLENVEVPIPSIIEQEKLTSILSSVDEKITINKKLKEKLTSLKRGLMQDLLTGKVRTV